MATLAIAGGAPVRTKPFPHWPEVDARDEQAVAAVVRSGKWWMYAEGHGELLDGAGAEDADAAQIKGSRVEAFERAFAAAQHVKHAITTTSGSGALEIACRAVGLKPGDEVITTPYTFIASSSCILNAGAIPVYVDIDPVTYNLDPSLVEAAITPHTRAILPVHFGGNIADVTKLRAIATKHRLKIIEDSAQAQGASLKSGWAGGLGDVGIFSLQMSKLLTCGEGGIFTTNDEAMAELAWSLRHYGREKQGLWYEHFRVGWHYRMTEMQGALLLTQLAKMPEQNARRERNARAIMREMESLPGIKICPQNPEAENKVYYLMMFRYDARAWDNLPRAKVLAAMAAEGIPCTGGYSWPLYENPLFTRTDFNGPQSPWKIGHDKPIDFRTYRGRCPVAERACHEEAIWINQNLLLGSEEDARDVARAFQKVYENRAQLHDAKVS